jgi:hypothetical protein
VEARKRSSRASAPAVLPHDLIGLVDLETREFEVLDDLFGKIARGSSATCLLSPRKLFRSRSYSGCDKSAETRENLLDRGLVSQAGSQDRPSERFGEATAVRVCRA